jgi:DNA-binding beta-propeller fold protein YncE
VTGLTVLPNGTSQTNILNYPTGVVLDADNNLFVVDSHHHRIIRLGPNGVQCLVGCKGEKGDKPNQLNTPRSLAFDSYGNIFVTDMKNSRIQKFSLATNSCSKYDVSHFQINVNLERLMLVSNYTVTPIIIRAEK